MPAKTRVFVDMLQAMLDDAAFGTESRSVSDRARDQSRSDTRLT
jgi:hypothetical protein